MYYRLAKKQGVKWQTMDLGKEDSLHRWDNLDYREPWARQDDAKESRTRNLHTNAADKARAGRLAACWR